MKIANLLIVTVLGTVSAILPHIEMAVVDRPMMSLSFAPSIDTCCLGGPTTTLGKFMSHVRQNRLEGPCHFEMRQIYRGNVTKYLIETEQILEDPKSNSTHFLVYIQAPTYFWSYIDKISFVQRSFGTNCSSLGMSRRPWWEKSEPRYFQGLQPADDSVPTWEIGRRRQIEWGDYLLEVPTGCLVNATELIIDLAHVYEVPGMQLQPVKDRGEIVAQSDACLIPFNRTAVNSYNSYLQIAESQPKDCEYSYKREYEWTVPASHISVKYGKTTISAHLALHESMLGDESRHITRLSLTSLSGPGCAQIALYAKRMRAGGELSARIRDLKIEKDSVSVESLWEFSDLSYDLRFVLPSGCTVKNPVVRVLVDDHREVDSTEASMGEVQQIVDSIESVVDDEHNLESDDSFGDVTTEYTTTPLAGRFLDQLKARPWYVFHPPEADGHGYYWNGSHVRSVAYL